jgi:hypothetical protein
MISRSQYELGENISKGKTLSLMFCLYTIFFEKKIMMPTSVIRILIRKSTVQIIRNHGTYHSIRRCQQAML